MGKQFRLRAEDVVRLIPPMGSCLASDNIAVGGRPVGYMYREEPDNEHDSGWRFFSGDESQEFTDNPDNFAVYDVNTIANYDRAIIPSLQSEAGVQLERVLGTDKFQRV